MYNTTKGVDSKNIYTFLFFFLYLRKKVMPTYLADYRVQKKNHKYTTKLDKNKF